MRRLVKYCKPEDNRIDVLNVKACFISLVESYSLVLWYIWKQLPEVFYKKALLKNFPIFTGKTPALESLFNKVAGVQACNFIKKRLQHRCFPVAIAKFLRTSTLKNICEQLLLYILTHVRPIFSSC